MTLVTTLLSAKDRTKLWVMTIAKAGNNPFQANRDSWTMEELVSSATSRDHSVLFAERMKRMSKATALAGSRTFRMARNLT